MNDTKSDNNGDLRDSDKLSAEMVNTEVTMSGINGEDRGGTGMDDTLNEYQMSMAECNY